MRLGVDFALEYLGSTRNGKRGDLAAQCLLGAIDLLLDFGLCRCDDAVGFGLRIGARLVDRIALELLALRDDIGRPRLGFGQHFSDPLFGPGKALPSLFARSQSVGDLLLALFDRTHQHRPDEPRAKPDEDREDDGLHQQRQVDVHDCPLSGRRNRYLSPAGISGLAYANSIAMPSPMMNEASIRPNSRNTLACSAGIISGWRAAPSRKREHMMPMPTQAPSAPKPIISPMPIPV